MSLFRHLVDLIPGDSDDAVVGEDETMEGQQMGADLRALRETIAEMEPEQLEQVFAECPHEPRVNFVEQGGITARSWRELAHQHIRDQTELQQKWGLVGKQAEPRDGGKVCVNHEAITEPRRLSLQNRTSSTRSRSRSEEVSGEVGGGVQVVEGAVGGTDTTTERTANTRGTKRGQSKVVWECGTGDKNCKLNRRAFVKAGDYYAVRGPSQADELDERFARTAEKAGVELPDETGRSDEA